MGSYLKAMWKALLILMILHFLVVASVTGYLGATERLNMDRVKRLKAMFDLTIEEEKIKNEEDAAALAVEKKKADDVSRLLAIGVKGPQTRSEVIKSSQEKDEEELSVLQQTQVNNKALELRVAQMIAEIERREKKIDEKMKTFGAEVQRSVKLAEDEGFDRALSLINISEPADAKVQFLNLIEMGQEDVVIDYLSAMSPRKANGILTEFKTVAEQKIRTGLIEKVRTKELDRLKEAAGQ